MILVIVSGMVLIEYKKRKDEVNNQSNTVN